MFSVIVQCLYDNNVMRATAAQCGMVHQSTLIDLLRKLILYILH